MTDAPKKRPPTSGTRKGNGAGKGQWGGPAKGASVDRADVQPPFPPGNQIGAHAAQSASC